MVKGCAERGTIEPHADHTGTDPGNKVMLSFTVPIDFAR
jgi:hypothetical protein